MQELPSGVSPGRTLRERNFCQKRGGRRKVEYAANLLGLIDKAHHLRSGVPVRKSFLVVECILHMSVNVSSPLSQGGVSGLC